MLKQAFLRDEAFLADIRAAEKSGGRLNLWWLGQSGFLLGDGRRYLLIDPYLSDSLTAKYARTNLPHVRISERVVDPSRLDFVSLVCCSHLHTDHLDPDTLRPILRANPALRIVTPEAIREEAAGRLGVDPARLLGMDDGMRRELDGFVIHGIPSAHDEPDVDAAGHRRFLGYVIEAAGRKLYHSGDTRPYDGLAERLRAFELDIGLLPINGRSAEQRVPGNLNVPEAVALGLGAAMRLVVPHHFDMFEFNTADPEEFAREARRRSLPFQVLRLGERLTLAG